jgi:hypothetical protein
MLGDNVEGGKRAKRAAVSLCVDVSGSIKTFPIKLKLKSILEIQPEDTILNQRKGRFTRTSSNLSREIIN